MPARRAVISVSPVVSEKQHSVHDTDIITTVVYVRRTGQNMCVIIITALHVLRVRHQSVIIQNVSVFLMGKRGLATVINALPVLLRKERQNAQVIMIAIAKRKTNNRPVMLTTVLLVQQNREHRCVRNMATVSVEMKMQITPVMITIV